MHRKIAAYLLAFAGVAGSFSCNLVNTSDGEGISGRGARAFDPYSANQSGAIRLQLEMYNGCEIIPGAVMGKGSTNIDYPNCQYRRDQGLAAFVQDPTVPQPTDPMQIEAGTNYFLNQLTIANQAINVHTDPANLGQVQDWVENLPPFNKLDWTGLGISSDEWDLSGISITPLAWTRTVLFDGANWQKVHDDTFKVEVIDPDGNVRATQVYANEDFLVQNPAINHNIIRWDMDSVAKPSSPDDTSVTPAPDPPPGFPPNDPVSFRSMFKIEHEIAIHPNKQLAIPAGLAGDGVIRVTWSQLPNDPFNFPVRFVDPATVPANCYSGADWTTPVACSFGNDPQITFDRPQNGQYYVPGETVHVHFAVKDSNGNYLHPKDHLPSFADYLAGKSNGILYFDNVTVVGLDETDSISAWQATGPKQDMKPVYSLSSKQFFKVQTLAFAPGLGNTPALPVNPLISFNVFPGAQRGYIPTTWAFTLPSDAHAGTYTAYLKINRFFMGERFTKMKAFDFQVGTLDKTKFPGEVGNCQICHRGQISLDNVRHGLAVDNIEGCVSCHTPDIFPGQRINPMQRIIHKIHMSSYKFPFPKNQCTTCHLTRAPTLRPSYEVCGSCHFKPHGAEFGFLEFTSERDVNQKTTILNDCGSACHANTPPTQHILPQN